MAETTVSNDFHPATQTLGSDKKTQLTFDPETKTAKLYVIVTVGGVQTSKSELYNNGIWNTAGQTCRRRGGSLLLRGFQESSGGSLPK